MTSDLDIFRTASVLIREHGKDAALEAAQRADAMLEKGSLIHQFKPDTRSCTVTVRRPRPWVVGHSLLRSVLSVTPRHEFIQLCDLVVGDAGQVVGEPGLRIYAVEFCGFDQRVGDGC